MQIKYIPAFIVLMAAAITSIINIVINIDILTGLKRLLFVIIIFYIIGLITRTVITNIITPKQKTIKTEEIQDELPQSESNIDSK